MKINAGLVLKLRREKSWSQEELALASGLNLRTVQRIEREASASLQSKKALASALDIDIRALDCEEAPMTPCPQCHSDRIYRYKEPVDAGGGYNPDFLPKLSPGLLSYAKVLPVVCGACGYLRLYASGEALEKLKSSKHWLKV